MTLVIGLIVALAAIAWMISDARARRMPDVAGYAVLTFLLLPVGLAAYFVRRPLKSGERREGGVGWNFCRYLALYWTVAMLLLAVGSCASVAGNAPSPGADSASQAGFAIGSMLGLGCLFGVWLVPLLVMLVIGLLLRKSSLVEVGPTGPLAGSAA
jgi:hypothetical protein